PQPGHRLQLDVKFLERIPGTRKRLYQFTAIDDCTRIRVLKVYDGCNQRTAIQFIDEVRRRLPFRVHVVQTDTGAEFQSGFHWHLERLDIRHVYIRPRSPHLKSEDSYCTSCAAYRAGPRRMIIVHGSFAHGSFALSRLSDSAQARDTTGWDSRG